MEIDYDQLRELIRTLEESGLTELEIKSGKNKIRLARQPGANWQLQPESATTATDREPTEEGTFVTSPFVGTFYRAASPDMDPFVEVGDTITPGTILCIVEAMKLMNEIEAEVEGTIVEALVENGKPVEYGDRLFKVKADP